VQTFLDEFPQANSGNHDRCNSERSVVKSQSPHAVEHEFPSSLVNPSREDKSASVTLRAAALGSTTHRRGASSANAAKKSVRPVAIWPMRSKLCI
jgi:hypothetical protein